MGSWVYLFSKFTHEALLLESLVFFSLTGAYVFFWIRRKRRLGAVGEEVPSSVVKLYLNQLIVDAEQMRAQLFGLLGAHGIQGLTASANYTLGAAGPTLGGSVAAAAGVAGAASGPIDPMLANQIAQFEIKMAEQTKAMQAVVLEKERLEKELAAARLNGGSKDKSAAPAAPAELVDKVKNLEAKLAEYSIIEDDLANLKRLQQENAQLKASLASGTPVPAAATAPETSDSPMASGSLEGLQLAPEPKEEEVIPAPSSKPKDPHELDLAMAFEEVISEPKLTPTAKAPAPAPAAAANPADDFEALVKQVEESLQPAAAPVPAAAPAPVETIAAAPPAATPASDPRTEAEKTDADLVAEFEKMLNA